MFAAVLPEFIEPENCPPNTLNLNPILLIFQRRKHCNRWCMPVIKNCSNRQDGMHANQVRDSDRPKPEHAHINIQSAAKKD